MDPSMLFLLTKESGALDINKLITNVTDKLLHSLEEDKVFHPEFQDRIKFITHAIHSQQKKGNEIEAKSLLEIINKLCLPILLRVSPSYDSREDSIAIVAQISSLLVSCLQFLPLQHSVQVLEQCLQSIKYFVKDLSHGTHSDHSRDNVLDIHCCLEVLHCFGNRKEILTEEGKDSEIRDTLLEALFAECLCVIYTYSNKTVVGLALLCITKLLRLDSGKLAERLSSTWEIIENIWLNDTESDKPLMVLCALANYYFPVNGICHGVDLTVNSYEGAFWRLLQCGISHSNPLTRKRAIYLIKRITDICQTIGCDKGKQPSRDSAVDKGDGLFWWKKSQDAKLVKIWEDFGLLVETLEEKQVHVIKPLLPRMQFLIEASVPDTHGVSLLHTSWLLAIIQRGLVHESVFIIRWITDLVLNLDLGKCPLIQQGQEKYLCTEFLLSIREPKLYVREVGVPLGTSPGCGTSIAKFFGSCWKALNDNQARATFFHEILKTIISNTWGPVPLLFIFHGLAQLPASPLLNREGVINLRKTLSSNITTWNFYMRGAVHHFCGQILINLIDKESVSPIDFMTMLSMFEREESLKRGSTLWNHICLAIKLQADSTESLQSTWSSSSICQYMYSTVQNMMQVNADAKFSASDSEVLQVTRMLLLCVDAGVIQIKSEPNLPVVSLVHLLSLLTDVINSVPSRPYMPPLKAEKAMEVLLSLIQENSHQEEGDSLSQCLTTMFDGCCGNVLTFIQQRFSSGWNEADDVPAVLLSSQMVAMVARRAGDSYLTQLNNLTESCISLLKIQKANPEVTMAKQIKRVAASCLLASLGKTSSMDVITQKITDYAPSVDFNIDFRKPAADISQKEWGKITSLYMCSQMNIMELFFQRGGKLQQLPGATLDSFVELLSISQGDTVLAVMNCIRYILPMALKEESEANVCSAISTCWSSVQESRRANIFWDVLQTYIHTVFQAQFLQQRGESIIADKILHCANHLFEFGIERSGIVNMLMSSFYSVWKSEEMLACCEKYIPLVVSASMFGTIYKKQDRQLLDVHTYLATLGSNLSINQLKPWSPQDAMVRVDLVSFLCRLSPKNAIHHRFVLQLYMALRAMYEDKICIPTGQTFSNSQVHREKNRLLQIMVLLLPFITREECTELWSFAWDLLMREMQPSVRHFLEWIVMDLAHRFSHLLDNLWTQFDGMTEKRTMSLCSMFCIMGHIGPHLDKELWASYYSTAMYKVTAWCMANHFNTRVYAQATLVKLWRQCEAQGLTQVLDSHKVLKPCLESFKDLNNSTRNVWKLLENYFFIVFNPIRDFSIETIFHTLPRLSLLHDDEWIPYYRFSKSEEVWNKAQTIIPLLNKSNELQKASPGPWRFKGIDETLEDEDESGNGNSNVQKKIMPWRNMDPDDEALEQLEHMGSSVDRGGQDGLVLVTSLIEKIPNLGGLCRTSEIFGVSEFVVRKLAYIEDKIFQSLSVTAQKWISIKEVYHERLPEYLEEKKAEGYTLIGVEQTANSVSLKDFQFPSKSLLLLGNEKEGIPVELINLLDVCVEIPQQGLIRSLNVHVSGALMVWEYRRQQLLKDK